MQVTMSLIDLLNRHGVEPDLITFRSRRNEEEYQELYGYDGLKFRIKKIGPEPTLPFEWNILYFNRVVNKRLKDYDLVINSNNTSHYLSDELPLLSYVHFPRKARLRSKKKDIHFPDGKNKGFWNFKVDFLNIARWLYKSDRSIGDNELTVANSEFTKQMILKHYEVLQEKVHVVYPPVKVKAHPPSTEKKEKSIVSLGRFSPDKRQLDQIKILENLPGFSLTLVGFVNDSGYFEKCKTYIEENGIENVTLLPNATNEERESALSEAQFYLHTLINEPFGITVVQAMAKGCIPIIHDSGGPKEIVTDEKLRYDRLPELSERLKKLSELSASDLAKTRTSIEGQVNNFNEEVFQRNMMNLILERLK